MPNYRRINKPEMIFICLMLFAVNIIYGQLTGALQKEITQNDEQAEQNLREGNLSEAARYYNQSAYILRNQQQNEAAAGYYLKIIDINKQLNNQRGLLITYNNLGMTYLDLEQFNKALPHLEKCLEISRNIDTKESVVSAMTNIAVALQGLEKFQESNQRIEPAVQMAKDINNLKLLRRCYGIIFENYDKLGQSDKSHQYFELYSLLDKELKKQEMKQVKQEAETEVSRAQADKQLTETELKIKKEELELKSDSLQKFEKLTREQQLEIELERQQSQIKDTLLKLEKIKKNYALIGLAIALIVLIILVFLLVKLGIASRKIAIQRDMLDLQNKNITASIRYAMTIQHAMLPDQESLNRLFESFIIYKPKDIVSGDFYWFSGFDEKKADRNRYFVALVDCTGHGVPGAFMSMIGNRLLNEIVNERHVEDPKEILELLNKGIRLALRQEQTDNNDGMDIILCRFEKQKNADIKMIFSGAKRVVYIFKKVNGELKNLKGERKSIGGVDEKKENLKFSNQEMILIPGDIIYMLTDGIIDQNGPDRKRFGSNRIEEYLCSFQKENMDKQKSLIENVLADYMQNEEQRDDISIIGLLVK